MNGAQPPKSIIPFKVPLTDNNFIVGWAGEDVKILDAAGVGMANEVSSAGVVLADRQFATSYYDRIIAYFATLGRTYTTESFAYAKNDINVGDTLQNFGSFVEL